MVDRYGTKEEFEKTAEALFRTDEKTKAEIEDYCRSVNRKHGHSLRVKKDEIPKSDLSLEKELDKTKWVYWEKHCKKKSCDGDGRIVVIGKGNDKLQHQRK